MHHFKVISYLNKHLRFFSLATATIPKQMTILLCFKIGFISNKFQVIFFFSYAKGNGLKYAIIFKMG